MTESSQSKWPAVALLSLAVSLAALVRLSPAGLKAPLWVAHLAIAILALTGALALARAYRRHVLADALVCAVLSGMLLAAAWIALGAGPRQCVSRIPSTGAMLSTVSESACRSAFGFGALVLGVMLPIAVRRWLHRRSAA